MSTVGLYRDASHPPIYDNHTSLASSTVTTYQYPAYGAYSSVEAQGGSERYNNFNLLTPLWFEYVIPAGGLLRDIQLALVTVNVSTVSGSQVNSQTTLNKDGSSIGTVSVQVDRVSPTSNSNVANGSASVDYNVTTPSQSWQLNGIPVYNLMLVVTSTTGKSIQVEAGEVYRFTVTWNPVTPGNPVWINRQQWQQDWNCWVNGPCNTVTVDPSQTQLYYRSNASTGAADTTLWTYPLLRTDITLDGTWSDWIMIEPCQEHSGTGVVDVNVQRACASASDMQNCLLQSMGHGDNCGDGPTLGQLAYRTCTAQAGGKNCTGWTTPIRYRLGSSPLPVNTTLEPSWFQQGGTFPYSSLDFTQTVPPDWIDGKTLGSDGSMLDPVYLTETGLGPITFADYTFFPGCSNTTPPPSCTNWNGECTPTAGYCDTHVGQPWMGTQSGISSIAGPKSRTCQVSDLSGNPANCPVDGGYGDWGAWSKCAAGSQVRTRPCNNPTPQYNGLSCGAQGLGASYQTQSCEDCSPETFTARPPSSNTTVWILLLVLVLVVAMAACRAGVVDRYQTRTGYVV